MAQPTPAELASHREELSVINSLIPVVEKLPDEGSAPAETSLQSEKKKWAKKREDEVAALTLPAGTKIDTKPLSSPGVVKPAGPPKPSA